MTGAEETGRPRLARRGRRRRPLEDRLAVRFPALATRIYASLTELTLRMPQNWRLRRLLIEYSVSRAFDALGRRDLDVLRTINHQDVIYDLSGWGWPEASEYRGRDGLVRFNELWLDQWSDPRFDIVSIEELESAVFLIHVRVQGTGRTSGVPVAMDNFQLIRIQDGLVWRNSFFRDRDEALAARAQEPFPSATSASIS